MPDAPVTAATRRQEPWDETEIQRLLAAPARAATGWTGAPPLDRPLIAFTAGVPDAPSFPVREIGEAIRGVLEREPSIALAYLLGSPQGERDLRELVATRMEPELGLVATPEQVTITSGAAQALENIFRTFLDPGDRAIVEAPTYGGALRTIKSAGGVPVPVEMDDGGMRIDLLEDTLARLEREGRPAKAIYVLPTFHNPAGTTMTEERRRQLIAVADRRHVLIVEDDAYGELRYRGEQVPSIFSLAGGHGVLRCGTVSKTIAPGLRIGWIKGTPALVDALVRMRFDNGTSPFLQRLVVQYVRAGFFEPHVAIVREVYRRKFEALDAALGEHVSRYASWNEPDGGFYVWVRLPAGVTCSGLAPLAWDEGVGFFAGPSFYTDSSGGGEQFIRLAFSAVPLDQIPEGCARLGRALTRAVATMQ